MFFNKIKVTRPILLVQLFASVSQLVHALNESHGFFLRSSVCRNLKIALTKQNKSSSRPLVPNEAVNCGVCRHFYFKALRDPGRFFTAQ